MAKVGYARVSTRSQKDDSQVDDLTANGCEKIFTDTASGKHAVRPELDKALAYLRKGDVFVITRLSRAPGRKTRPRTPAGSSVACCSAETSPSVTAAVMADGEEPPDATSRFPDGQNARAEHMTT